MPVCWRSSAWVVSALRSLSNSTQLSLHHPRTYHRLKTHFTTPGTRPGAASIFGSYFGVQVSRSRSMSSSAMSQRMVWVDLEVSHRVYHSTTNPFNSLVAVHFISFHFISRVCSLPQLMLHRANHRGRTCCLVLKQLHHFAVGK